ncbi:MAG: Trp family transcriptional regulator [Thermodesulfobacteriota bacterium]|jgi:uncharacterized protein YerC
MPKPKFDRVELNRLLRTGKPQKEIAQALNVSESAISRGKKELKNAVVRNVAFESAHKVVESHLDTLGQLRKINEGANELLDLLMRWNRGDEGALQILESQVKKVRHGKKEEEAVEFRFKDPRELALRAMQEIRGQLNLQLDIFKTLYDMQAIADFQKEVLTAIGEVDANVRARIIQRLKEGRIIRQSIEFHREPVWKGN